MERDAPPLELAHLLQAPAEAQASWASLRGNAVVLEFWATWCMGCREAIPHLNRLHQRLNGRAVRFLSISDEEPELVRRFLKDYPMAGWVGLDPSGRVFERFGVVGRPTTVLVDGAGVVRGVGNAKELTEATLEDLMAGRAVKFSRTLEAAAALQAAPEPLFELMVRPAAPAAVSGNSPGAMGGKPGQRWQAYGWTLEALLAEAYGVPRERVRNTTGEAWLGEMLFDVSIAEPELTNEARVRQLKRLLAEAFGAEVRLVPVETTVYVLRRAEGVETRLRAGSANPGRWMKPGELTAVAMPTSVLAALLQRTAGRPVLDETGLTGRYDLELRWEAGRPASLAESVKQQLGLELAEARRMLDSLEVRGARRPRGW